jgi:hypothetical protein
MIHRFVFIGVLLTACLAPRLALSFDANTTIVPGTFKFYVNDATDTEVTNVPIVSGKIRVHFELKQAAPNDKLLVPILGWSQDGTKDPKYRYGNITGDLFNEGQAATGEGIHSLPAMKNGDKIYDKVFDLSNISVENTMFAKDQIVAGKYQFQLLLPHKKIGDNITTNWVVSRDCAVFGPILPLTMVVISPNGAVPDTLSAAGGIYQPASFNVTVSPAEARESVSFKTMLTLIDPETPSPQDSRCTGVDVITTTNGAEAGVRTVTVKAHGFYNRIGVAGGPEATHGPYYSSYTIQAGKDVLFAAYVHGTVSGEYAEGQIVTPTPKYIFWVAPN